MEILSEKALAQKLRVSPWTVRNWRLQEGLPFVRTGNGRIHYSLASVEAWWAEHETSCQAKQSTDGIRRIG